VLLAIILLTSGARARKSWNRYETASEPQGSGAREVAARRQRRQWRARDRSILERHSATKALPP
jgi:hypothetical protein